MGVNCQFIKGAKRALGLYNEEDLLTVQGIKEENLMGMILPKEDKKVY